MKSNKASTALKKPTKKKDNKEILYLKLYIAGQTPKSLAAMENLEKICDEHLKGKYRVQIIDLLKNPQLAKDDQIVAIPTLVRKLPLPLRRAIGDLSNATKVLVGLQLISRNKDLYES